MKKLKAIRIKEVLSILLAVILLFSSVKLINLPVMANSAEGGRRIIPQ